MKEKNLDDMYAMFICSHFNGVGSFNVEDIRHYTPCDAETAQKILDYGIKSGRCKKNDVGGYFHVS